MKKIVLSIAFSGFLMFSLSACNSTKNVSGTTDTMIRDTAMSVPKDSMKPMDTAAKMPPDTTKTPPVQ